MPLDKFAKITCVLFTLWACSLAPAQAGIFDLPAFVEPGQWAVGLEPEVVLSKPTGAAFNLKPKMGINNLINLQGVIGTGSGSRQFRVGLITDLEWFPDVDNQPGIATPVQTIYYRLDNDLDQFTYGISPTIYKTFKGAQDGSYTPFISIPVGWNISQGRHLNFLQAVLGCLFQFPGNEHFRVSAEAGFNVEKSFSYISGGVTYFQ